MKKFLKVFYLFSLIFFNSCMVGSINDATYTFNDYYYGNIVPSQNEVEVYSLVNFTINDLVYKGPKIFGDPIIEKFSWDLYCDGKTDYISKVNFGKFVFDKKGAYEVCVKVTYYLEFKKDAVWSSIIKYNNKINVYPKISKILVSSLNNVLIAGELNIDNPITVKVYDNENLLYPNAPIYVKASNFSSLYQKIDDEYILIDGNIVYTDFSGQFVFFVKAKESIINNNSFDQSNIIEFSNLKGDLHILYDNLIVLPNLTNSFYLHSIGGDSRHQVLGNNLEDFGNVKIKLLDKYLNPVYSNPVNISISSIDGSPLSNDWLIKSGVKEGTNIELLSNSNSNFASAGVVDFRVIKNNDYTAGTALVTISSDDLIYSFDIGVAPTPANIVISADSFDSFGQVVVNGYSNSLFFTLTNTGSLSANIDTELSNNVFLNNEFSYVGGAYPGTHGTCSNILEGGLSCKVEVYFSPTSVGHKFTNIEIFYFDSEEDQVSLFNIHARGIIVIPRVYVGGDFDKFGTSMFNRIAKLNTDGSVDTTYSTGLGTNKELTILRKWQDKLYIAGNFNTFNLEAVPRVARLNSDGSLDTSYNMTGAPSNTTMGPYGMVVDIEGRLILAGNLRGDAGDIYDALIRRYSSQGIIDENYAELFNSSFSVRGTIHKLVANINDSKVYIVMPYTYPDSKLGLFRLTEDGSRDYSFNNGDNGFSNEDGTNIYINHIKVLNDAKIIVSGSFTHYNNILRKNLLRLNTDGTLDETFNIGNINGSVSVISEIVNNKFFIAGTFTNINGINVNHIAMLDINGAIDTSFNSNFGLTGSAKSISSIKIDNNAKLVVAGYFNEYNNTFVSNIMRLNQDGSLDTSFNTGNSPNSYVYDFEIEDNNTIIIGGAFTDLYTDGLYNNRIAALDFYGEIDDTFNSGTGFNNKVNSITTDSAGKIIVGGKFSSYDGNLSNKIARINPDGTFDETFNIGLGPNQEIRKLITHKDKIYIIGDFNTYNNYSVPRLARLNSDGSLDTSFNTTNCAPANTSMGPYDILVDSQDRVVVAGNLAGPGDTCSNNFIRRYNNDGTLDVVFSNNQPYWFGLSGTIFDIAVSNDNKIYINIVGSYLFRITEQGMKDTTFNGGQSGFNNSANIEKILVQDDDKILVAGTFNRYNEVIRRSLLRLNYDGSLDTSFDIGQALNGTIIDMSLDSDGKIIIVGGFKSYNNIPKKYIARLNSDGSLDAYFGSELENFGFNNPIKAVKLFYPF